MPLTLQARAPIDTWFKVGGSADSLAEPQDADALRSLLRDHETIRMLGDGANLLVDDCGVDGLVIHLKGDFAHFDLARDDGLVYAGAGVHLFKLINASVEAGLAGLEVLAGVPASVGGAIVMNAGGAYGQVADCVERVFALTREGEPVDLHRRDIAFAYRESGLNHLFITGALLRLTPTPKEALRARKEEINTAKKRSQPLRAHSAGCCFKNPTLPHEVPGIAMRGMRTSAGLLIDRAGLKGTRLGCAMVSDVHANFIVIDREAPTKRARDVINLMELVQQRVHDSFGVHLEREVVVWSKEHPADKLTASRLAARPALTESTP